MARASTYTLLPLDRWATIMGIDLFEFNQFNFPVPKSAQCLDVTFQYEWQRDKLSREEIARAIANAEQMIADELHYWPAPTYFVDESVIYPRPYQRDRYGFGGTPRHQPKTVQLEWHQVISGGVINRNEIGEIDTIAFSDPDGDDIKERFTCSITDAAIADITDANEIGLYFTETDRNDDALSETWRIRPVTVTVSGDTATFIGHAAQLVKPDKTFGYKVQKLEVGEAENYVTDLEVWWTFTDSTFTDDQPYQGVAMWSDIPGCITPNCTFQIKPLCLGQHENGQGIVAPTFGSPATWPHYREPDRLSVNYLAGLPLHNGQMQTEMAHCVAYLAANLLANEKCGCERNNRILAYWRERITMFEDSTNARAYSKDYTNIPFPVTRGGLYAWQRVSRWRHQEAVSL